MPALAQLTGQPLRCPTPRPRAPRRALTPRAIGFDLPGSSPSNKSAERCADDLSRAAASLLLYQPVLKTRPAVAFLDVLLHLQKGSPLRLMERYSEMWRALAADADATSWSEHLVDQALRGADNPFARAAAQGEDVAHLMPAAAHDWGVLQSLAVTEATLTSWVRDTVSGVSEGWADAAGSVGPRGTPPAGEPVDLATLLPEAPPPAVLAPLSAAQRAALRSELMHQWEWGAGAELVRRFHAAHGVGLVSLHRTLKWTGDALQAQDALEGVLAGAGEVDEAAVQGVADALAAGLLSLDLSDRQRGAAPTVVHGCARAGYAAAAVALRRLETLVPADKREAAAGVRTVLLPQARLRDAGDLAWRLSQHPRVRFAVLVIVAKDLDAEVAATLAGGDGFSWPANAAVVAACDAAPGASRLPGVRVPVSGA